MRFLIIILFLSSCAAKITTSSTTVERDSLAVRTIHHRDTIRIKGDSIKVIVKETVRDTIIVEKQGRAELDITKKNGRTTTKCKCDSIQKVLNIVLSDTSRYKFVTKTITKTVIQNHTSGFDWFCRGVTFLLIILIAAVVLHRLGIFKIPFL